MDPNARPGSLNPRTLRILYRLATALGVIAGVLMIIAFWLGLAREADARWSLLILGVLFLSSPLALRLLLPAR
jgi:hypothetical protein